METFVEFIGMIAAVLTTISFLPQVVKTYKDKSAENLSFTMLVVFLLGVGLWLVYGFFKNSNPLIIANSITLVLAGVLLFFKINYSSNKS